MVALPDADGESTTDGEEWQATPVVASGGSRHSAPGESREERDEQATSQTLPSALPAGLARIEPLVSGREWERVDPQPVILQRTNNLLLLGDRAEPSVRAYFKWPKAGSKHSSAYSIGIDRVGYELAALLALPVPATYLEEFEGHHGLVSIRVPDSQPWRAIDESVLQKATFTNRDSWPILLGLDVLLGNTDRNDDSILVQLEERQQAPRAETIFIDYGHSALWPPWKFEPSRALAELLKADEDTPLTGNAKGDFRGVLPRQIRASFPLSGTPERAVVVETLGRITHDAIHDAVGKVSADYFTDQAADLTIRWIDHRRGRIATLVDEVFPL